MIRAIRSNPLVTTVSLITFVMMAWTLKKYFEFQDVLREQGGPLTPEAMDKYNKANDAAGFSIIALLAWCVLIAAITTAWAVWRAGQDPEEDLDDPGPNTPMDAPWDEGSRAA
jgi:hypothetical protein